MAYLNIQEAINVYLFGYTNPANQCGGATVICVREEVDIDSLLDIEICHAFAIDRVNSSVG